MTSDELQERIIEIAAMPGLEAAREMALKELKDQTGITLKVLRQSYNQVKKARADFRGQTISEKLKEDGYFLIRNGSKVRVGVTQRTRLNGHAVHETIYMPVPEFDQWTRALDPSASGDDTPGKVFVRDPMTPRYVGTIIDPNGGDEVDGHRNLWAGFGDKPVRDDKRAALFREHVLRVCSGNEVTARYMLDWIASGFQNPTHQIGTAIVLIGEPGTGKGMIGNLLTTIWGGHGAALRTKRSLVGDFNSHLRSLCFVFSDEALFAGDKQAADALKALITEPTIDTEDKFESRIQSTNMLNILIATNHEHAIQMDPRDRRFAVIRVPDDMPGSGDPYWRKLKETCGGPEGRAAVLWDMLNRDISEFHPERDRPTTEAGTAQKLSSLQGDLLYWRQVAAEGTLQPGQALRDLSGPGDWPTDDQAGTISKRTLYGFYAAFHARNSARGQSPVVAVHFWRRAREIGIVGDDVRPSSRASDRSRQVEVASFDDIETRLTDWLAKRRVK